MINFTRERSERRWQWLLVMLVAGCSGPQASDDPGGVAHVPGSADPGAPVIVDAPLELTALNHALETAKAATSQELRASHGIEFADELGYDPLTATNLAQVLTGLSVDAEAFETQLSRLGFAIGTNPGVSSFASGYSQIYAADLPVFISSDMVLEAMYRSHDKILQLLEEVSLRPRLERLLLALRRSLAAEQESFSPETASDLNFYLGVALSLLNEGRVDDREPPGVREFVEAALQAEGEQTRILFGTERRVDFSQFKPRGHYAGDPALEGYFRAMIWLGRIDLRLLETQSEGNQVLRRRQVEAMIGLRGLLDPAALDDYLAIDRTLTLFVGEHDYMTIQDVDNFLELLGSPEDLQDVDDSAMALALVEGHFGEQRIASHVMRRSSGDGTFPLNASFALFGQRYTVDSHVLSNVVYDRVPTRVVPDPLDVAFGALGNDQALALIGTELDDEEGYAGQLSAMRMLVDEHPHEYWESSLYTTWLSALRTLSPSSTPASDLPAVAQTEAWGRRLLNTQLSSWAQLRHNNVLYVKQSYTSSALCEYPDAYVDPYPEFFLSIVMFAERAIAVTAELKLDGELGQRIQDYFGRVARINLTLAEMADVQRTGEPHSAEHMAFINQAVTTDVNCDGTILGHTGWYSELHFDPLQAVEMDPAITDVHTDIGGPLPVAREPSVLHVGTGLPRYIVMTVESCQGPRAYAGLVSAYHEVLEDGLTRLTDEDWKERIFTQPPSVDWFGSLLVE